MKKFALVYFILSILVLTHIWADEQDCSIPLEPIEVTSSEDLSCDLECEEINSYIISDAFFSMTFGKFVGVDRSYASAGGWLAKAYKESLYFVDVRWHHLCNGDNGANAGFGARFGNDCRGCGGNVYYDWRRFKCVNFNQISAGIEAWIFPWEAHLNMYLPFESYAVLTKEHVVYEGGYEFFAKKTAYSCKMASLLFGREFNLSNCLVPSLLGRAYAGPYWISHSKKQSHFGGLAVVDLQFYEYFSWRSRISTDPIFKTRADTTLSINIPLGCHPRPQCSCRQQRFYRRPDRLDLIPIDTISKCHYNWDSP